MKKNLAVILILMMIPLCAAAQEIYTDEKISQITKGVTQKNIRKFYGDYSLNINCIEADLKNKDLSFELLKNDKGVDKTDTVLNLAKKEEGVVSAINGDFFSYYKDGQSFSLGIEIKDGELLQSHIQENMAAGFVENNLLDFSYIKFNAKITMQNETEFLLSHINKPTDYYGALLMYTSSFNSGVSPFLPNGVTVVTVENERVAAKGVSLGGTVLIPENGYILVIDDAMTPILDINTTIGDEIKLSVFAEPSIENITTAFGGGTLLLQNGKKTAITHAVNGNAPRTAIGTNEDGSKIYMITVDGRQSISRGASLEALQDICLELGCVNAMNLDGGGSTAMVGKTLENQELHMLNSPSENRKVINALGIVSSAKPNKVAGYKIFSESDTVLFGDSADMNIVPYDENFNRPLPFATEFSWNLEMADGKVELHTYYPQKGDKEEHTIKLIANGKEQAEYTFNVINTVSGIITAPSYKLAINESINQENFAQVFDEKGRTAKVRNLSLLNPSYDETMISFENGRITALKEGISEVTLSHGNAKRTINFICGGFDAENKESVVIDSKNTEKNDGETFNIIGGMKLNTFIERLCYLRATSVLQSADIKAVVGGRIEASLTPQSLTPIMADTYSEKHYDNACVIAITQKNASFGVNSQWTKIAKAVKESPQKNLFILLNNAPELKNDIEKAAFEHILNTDKNVFVIYNGVENNVIIKGERLRYISLADGGDYKSIPSKMKNIKYLSFNITENDVTYSFKNLY